MTENQLEKADNGGHHVCSRDSTTDHIVMYSTDVLGHRSAKFTTATCCPLVYDMQSGVFMFRIQHRLPQTIVQNILASCSKEHTLKKLRCTENEKIYNAAETVESCRPTERTSDSIREDETVHNNK